MVKRHKKSDQVPPICTEIGSEIRTEHIENHLKSAIHAAACRANRLQSMSQPELKQESSTIDSKISKSQNVLFWKSGGYMLTVFNDVKRETLSAWSWPSCEAAFQRRKQFLENENGAIQEFSENPQDFRYLFPASQCKSNEKHFDKLPGNVIMNRRVIRSHANTQ